MVRFASKQKGRYLRLRALTEVAGQPWTSIAELRPLVEGVTFRAGTSAVQRLGNSGRVAMKEPEVQFAALKQDLANRARFERVAPETFRAEALIRPTDRDPVDVVLRRTAALAADLKRMTPAPNLNAEEAQLRRLESDGRKVDVNDKAQRLALFKDVCRVRRQIAFKNPLLKFNQILFIKRHRSVYGHMCDQYYGITQQPGGGLFVLAEPFGPEPQVRDLLAESVVERGRLKGQKLGGGPSVPPPLSYDGVGNLTGPDQEGGSFLSPCLSYDAKKIVFAYVECKGDKTHRHHTDPNRGHWYEGRSYHIFQANVDGSGLEQLTDGTWNDFHPCYLPNGRIALITERRGGYLRCGRVCPTYTLYDMAADGSDLTALSVHETNEWHPSVTHDGRILYTRWDYVDRFGCTAHHPWITSLDGRDSRAVQGNFAPRNARPDMELSCRVIPNSRKFVATAAPHHGQAFGSLVLVDPQIPDDDRMSAVKRITPDVGFPESQDGREAYGTAWPLSEDYYLCVYDATMACGAPGISGNYGLYLVDSWGNKELIYRDPQIACESPIPLVPQPMPSAPPALAKPFRDAPGRECRRRSRARRRLRWSMPTTASSRGPRGRRSKPCVCSRCCRCPSRRAPRRTRPGPEWPWPATRWCRSVTCWGRFLSRRTARRGSRCRPTASCSFRPWTSAGWQSSRCARRPISRRASTWSATAATSPSTAPRRRPRTTCWPCAGRHRRSGPMWTARPPSATLAWCSRCWTATA